MATQEHHVIFGTGPLGLAVMRALVNKGQSVTMVNRSGKAAVPAGVTVLAGDAYDVNFTRQATQNAAVVYQCAQPRYFEWPEKFPPLQAAIMAGTAAAGAKFIVGDNLYMYGKVTGPLHENLPTTPHTRKGQVRAAMAAAVLEAHHAGKVRAALGRGSDFFGPAVLGSALGERFFYPLLQGKAAQVAGNLDAPHSWTYIDDFGTALVILGEREEALGQVWHVPNAPPVTMRDLLKLIEEVHGQPVKMNTTGKMMMRIGGLFIPEAREMVEMMYEFEAPFVVDHSKFARAFGDHTTPLRAALTATLDWYKANPAH